MEKRFTCFQTKAKWSWQKRRLFCGECGFEIHSQRGVISQLDMLTTFSGHLITKHGLDPDRYDGNAEFTNHPDGTTRFGTTGRTEE